MRWHWAYRVSLLLVVLLGGPVGAQPEGLEGYQIVRITVSDAAQLEILERLAAGGPGFEIWSDGIGLGFIDARVPPEQKAALDASGLKYVVVVADLQAHYDELFRAPPGGDFFEAYRSYDEHVAFLNSLVADYPDLAEMVDLGPSARGRRLWAIRITGPAGDKPAVLYHGGQHGNEIMGPPVIAYAARHLLTNYDADPDVKALVDGVELFLLPMMNPDGYERGSRYNANGVDLNRNWGGPGSRENPFSQPETAAMRDFFLDHPGARAHLDFHSSGEIILWPWGHRVDECVDNGTFFLISEEMHARIRAVRGTRYGGGTIYRMLYPLFGGSVDYSYGVHRVWAYVFELNELQQPPQSEIIPTCEELTEAILYFTSWIHDCNQNGIPDIVEIKNGEARDCNQNGAPDECEDPEELDCNNNGVWDACDTLDGTSEDCNENRIPDECEPDKDCNDNGVRDICDIFNGTSEDCNQNVIPDECDIAEGTSEDCDENGIPDECQPQQDCNENGVPDECDVREGTSEDCNENGTPDECEMLDPLDGNALSFERNSARVIVSNFDGFPTGEITVSQWLRTSDPSRQAGIFSYAVPEEDDEFLILGARNFVLFLHGGFVLTDIAITDEDWHHVAFTWASVDGVFRLYLDGIERFSAVVRAGHTLVPGGTLVLADDQDSVGGGFDSRQALFGTIDELRVWNVVRSGEEIRADMRRRLSGDEPGLVSYWRFDEGEGAIAEDLSGDNDGEVLRAVWIETFDEFCECVREPAWQCDGDVDGDGQVNPVDSGLVQAAFGSADEQDVCNYDVDCDGQINPVDSGIVQSLFGTCEQPREVCP